MVAELPAPEEINISDLLWAFRAGALDCVCVLGPTASGKTRYAVDLARRMAALDPSLAPEIISADSRQVYIGMDIGTGKDLSEYGKIPHHLLDIIPAGEKYNVYRYQKDFAAAYAGVRGRGHLPILCGGTGLYIEAAVCMYDFHKEEPQVPLSQLPKHTYFIGTLVDRDTRNARIDARLDARLKEGMVDEVRGLMEKGIKPEDLLWYGLEYKFVTQYLIGEMSYEDMRFHLANAIHQFAKRQMTWFRGMERSGIVINWVIPPRPDGIPEDLQADS